MPTDKTPETSKPADKKTAPGLKDFKKEPAAKSAAVKPAVKPKPKAKPAKPKREKSGVSFPAALVMSVIAAGAGAAGGWMLPNVFDPANAAPAQAITKNTEAISTSKDDIQSLVKSFQALSSEVGKTTTEVGRRAGQAGEIAALQTQIADIQSVDIAAQRAEALDPITARVDAMETLITPEGEETGVASQLLERLTALETRLEDLQAAPPQSMEPTVLSYSTGGDTGDVSEPAATDIEPSAPVAEAYDLAANFPRDAMLEALSVQSQNTQEPSWLRKLIGKHIQTDDLSAAEARASILNAQAMVQQGDVAGAVAVIETLNPTLRAAAHGWMTEAKAALK